MSGEAQSAELFKSETCALGETLSEAALSGKLEGLVVIEKRTEGVLGFRTMGISKAEAIGMLQICLANLMSQVMR